MQTIRYTNYSGLMNAGTSDFLMRDDELVAVKNVWVYKLGKLEKVPGYTLASSSQIIASESPSYLHWYFDTGTRTNYLLGVSDSTTNLTLKYIAPNAGTPVTTWTTITGISTSWNTYATSSVDMENYLGKAFIVGHKTADTFVPNATVDGTTFSVADTDLTSMPQGKFIVRYRDLLYVLYARTGSVTYPSRGYYSDDPVNGAITWNNLATKFVEFGYDDGDEITGATEALDKLIVFKQRSMWRYDEAERRKIADIGCDSYRSIQKINGILYWFNRDGFWRWDGSTPVMISAKAQPFIDALNQETLDNVVSTQYNGFEYRAYIGTVVVDGTTYTNAWFCWDTRREACYIRCTHDTVGATSNFTIDGKRRAYFSTGTGHVMRFATKVDNIYADNGNEIDSFFITKAYDFGAPEDAKYTNHLTIFTKHGEGLSCAVDVNKANSFSNTNIVRFDRNIGHADITSTGNRYQYKFHEKSLDKSWQFEGFALATEVKEKEE